MYIYIIYIYLSFYGLRLALKGWYLKTLAQDPCGLPKNVIGSSRSSQRHADCTRRDL